MHIVDHLFIFVLFVVQPVYGAWDFNRYVKGVEAGDAPNRIKLYRETSAIEWAAFAVLIGAWYLLGRPLADLGYVAPGGIGFWAGSIFVAAFSIYLLVSWRQAKQMSDEEKEGHIASFGKLQHFLPQNDRELRSITGVSITAGIVEETVYRGFMLWYLVAYIPTWAAVIVSAIAFGLGHSYQGTGGVARVTAIGLVFGAMYILTGSIWVPIVAHILLDALQALSIVEIFRKDTESPAPQPA